MPHATLGALPRRGVEGRGEQQGRGGGREERTASPSSSAYPEICVVERDDAYLRSSSPGTQNGYSVCVFCWSRFLSPKIMWRTYFAFASCFANSVGDSPMLLLDSPQITVSTDPQIHDSSLAQHHHIPNHDAGAGISSVSIFFIVRQMMHEKSFDYT